MHVTQINTEGGGEEDSVCVCVVGEKMNVCVRVRWRDVNGLYSDKVIM